MRPLVILVLCFGAAACTSVDAPLSPVFGEARASMKEQIIAQGPPSDLPPSGSAVTGAAAIERYLRGAQKQPQQEDTSGSQVVLTPNAGAANPTTLGPASAAPSAPSN